MGHSLEQVIQPVLDKYSRDVHDAHSEGFEQGAQYVEGLILDRIEQDPEHRKYLKELLTWIESRPSR